MITDDRGSRSGGLCLEASPGESTGAARGLREAGRVDEAEALYRRAIERDDRDFEAWHGYGVLLHGRGDLEGSAGALRRSAELRPGDGPARLALGDALRDLGRTEEAAHAYIEAIRLDPTLAGAYAALGRIYFRAGRVDEAAILLTKAVELAPDRAIYWECLGELLDLSDRSDEAIRCWERAVALSGKARARPHLGLAWSLQQEHRPAEAEAHLRAAIEIEPGSGRARLSLGILEEERGEFTRAEACYRAAIRLQPDDDSALARLASLLRDRLPDADLGAAVARVEDPAASDWSRARLLFAIGQVMDARGDHPLAAECVREANAFDHSRALAHRRFEPDDHRRYIDGLIRAFDRPFFASAAPAGDPSRRPVFIVGLPRSGTSLLEQVLASHPEVHGAGELIAGRRLFNGINYPWPSADAPPDLSRILDADRLAGMAETYLGKLRSVAGDAPARVVDKMPDNYMYLGLLVAMVPGATVIHCRRDLRDVALSCWMADFHSLFWTNRPEDIAAKFRGYLRLMDHWRATLPLTIHEVPYEETVSDLEAVARRLLSALGLDWHPACLDFHTNRRPVRTASFSQVRKPLYQTSVARWKRYESEVPELFEGLPGGPGPP